MARTHSSAVQLVGQGAARFSHYALRLFEILTVKCTHPAREATIAIATVVVVVRETWSIISPRVCDERACEKVELRQCDKRSLLKLPLSWKNFTNEKQILTYLTIRY